METEIMSRKKKRGPRTPPDTSSVLITAVQAAKQYGVPYTTLRDLAFKGQIPVLRIGTAWYFERRDLASFVERAKQTLNQ